MAKVAVGLLVTLSVGIPLGFVWRRRVLWPVALLLVVCGMTLCVTTGFYRAGARWQDDLNQWISQARKPATAGSTR